MKRAALFSTAAMLQYPVTLTSVKLLYMLKVWGAVRCIGLHIYSLSAIAPSPSTQSLTLTSTTVSASSFTSSTIAQNISGEIFTTMFILTIFVLFKFCISDGGSGEDMPTTSNMDSDVAIPTATTITPKSTIATGEPIKQGQWLSAILLPDMEARTKTITLTTTVTSTPVSEMCGYTKGELIQTL